ncbi:DUF1534 domain-containing protein [Pseudomonas tremae]|uniref:DUF1534 domain-containing protein n=1 Tax=Pseudomonas coronafaciens pv. coronafaciens TaxID=235275 RepID=A0AAE6QNX9_9PSED|nr:DUF1534 domain-containing protein [Pseudomonas tremae]MCF5808734.1 DUF1534 domain-containing protein [Pseudomonas tremae]QGT84590.1 DUF1534 domain-containing protein [Pseudomonas coronafaciens pv. coronafaciens]
MGLSFRTLQRGNAFHDS